MKVTMQAVNSMNNLNKDDLLGYMIFYYIPDLKILHNDLEVIFDKNSMSKEHLPNKIKEHDAYRRATGRIRGTVEVEVSPGHFRNAKLNIDEVRNDKDGIVRVIGRKVTDASHDDVSYEPVGRLIFDKNTKTVKGIEIGNTANEHDYGKIIKETIDLYKEWTQYHTKDTVRTIVNRIVQSMQPVTIIKGAYFVPKTEFDTMNALQDVITDLKDYATEDIPQMEIIPLLDTVEQRDMVQDRANKELVSDIDSLIVELSDMLADDKEIKERTIKRLACEFHSIKDKTENYSKLLEARMNVVDQQFLTAFDKFTKLKAQENLAEESL